MKFQRCLLHHVHLSRRMSGGPVSVLDAFSFLFKIFGERESAA